MSGTRKFYYWLIGKLSDVEFIRTFIGFGLYDREVIEWTEKAAIIAISSFTERKLPRRMA